MRNLHLYPTAEDDELIRSQDSSSYSLATPALNFLIDFDRMEPLAVDSSTSADELRTIMFNTQIRLVPVMNRGGHFVGIISLADISDQKLLQKQAEGIARKELRAADLMTRRRDLIAFDALEIAESTIGDVIWAMKKSGQSYCLLLERRTHSIQGVFSAHEIAEKLRVPVNIEDKSSFYRVFAPVSVVSR